MFAIAPDELDWIELRRIGRQLRQPKLTFRSCHILLDAPTPMGRQPVPDNEELAGHLAPQVAQEVEDLRRFDRAPIEPEVEVPHRDPRDGRQHLPIEAQLQHRRVPAWGPGPHPVRPFTQARFVDEDDGAAFRGSVFFNVGHTVRFQRRMAASSRSRAWPVGRWQLHPSCRSSCQTRGWLYRILNWVSINCATRLSVQSPVGSPRVSGPAFSARVSVRRLATVSFGGRPARPALRNAPRPCWPSRCCHRWTDWRETPSRRATSAGHTPCFKSRAAANRRRSIAVKSRLAPACAILTSSECEIERESNTSNMKCHCII